MSKSSSDIRLASRQKVTLREIADASGYSVGSVSAVVNRTISNSRVSKEARKRILEIARQMNYQPHFAAQSLIRQSSRTLGFYLGGMEHSDYGRQLLNGVEKACLENEFDILLMNLQVDDPLQRCVDYIQQLRMDGVLILQPWQTEAFDAFHSQLSGRVVYINWHRQAKQACSVYFDNHAAMGLAVDYLVSLGHSRIGFIGSCIKNPKTDPLERLEGYRLAMKRCRLAIEEVWVHDVSRAGPISAALDNHCQNDGRTAVEVMMTLPLGVRPTALIAHNDLAAGGALRRLHEMNVKLPEEMSLIGVDNTDQCDLLTPSLTSLSQPMEAMGYQAASLLIGRLLWKKNNKGKEAFPWPKTIRFEPTLIKRESCVAPVR